MRSLAAAAYVVLAQLVSGGLGAGPLRPSPVLGAVQLAHRALTCTIGLGAREPTQALVLLALGVKVDIGESIAARPLPSIRQGNVLLTQMYTSRLAGLLTETATKDLPCPRQIICVW